MQADGKKPSSPSWLDRLQALGLDLPQPPSPSGAPLELEIILALGNQAESEAIGGSDP